MEKQQLCQEELLDSVAWRGGRPVSYLQAADVAAVPEAADVQEDIPSQSDEVAALWFGADVAEASALSQIASGSLQDNDQKHNAVNVWVILVVTSLYAQLSHTTR